MANINVLTKYKINKAIAVIAGPIQPGGEKHKHALNLLRAFDPEVVIPIAIQHLSKSANPALLQNLLMSLVSSKALPELVNALASQDETVKPFIVRALCKSDKFDPNELLPLFSEHKVSHTELGEILSHHSSRLNAKQLVRMLDNASSSLRPVLYKLINQNLTLEALPVLIAKTNSPEPMVRVYLAKTISRFHTVDSINTLVQMLGDPVNTVRDAALEGLGNLKTHRTTEVICQMLSDPDLTVQATAIDTLVKINAPDTVKHLISVLQDESEYVRRAAVEVLNEVGNQNAIKDLLNALRDADWWVKVRAADALGSIGGPKVFSAVLALIKDPDEFMRRTAVEILNTCKDVRALDRLIEALEDNDWWVRERAIDALAALGDKRAVPHLLRMLESTPEAGHIIIKALTKLGDRSAIDSVLNQLRGGNENAQKEALRALSKLTDRARILDVQDAITEIIKTKDPEIRSLATQTISTLAKKFGLEPGTKESLLVDFNAQSLNQSSENQSAENQGSENRSSESQSGRKASEDRSTDEIIPNGNRSIKSAEVIDAATLKNGDLFSERYRIIKQVGKGAFGVVVLVEDTVVCDQFILKFLNPYVASDKNVIQRFTHELRYSRKITHPNVIRIYDFITHGKNYAISMEYFPSHSMTYEINRGIVSEPQRAIHLLRQICSGMTAAQKVNVVHRDLKPGNILVNKNDQVKIVDFGLAAAASKADARLTKTGILVGTPSYMAPEQVRSKTIDARTDIYALGIIMYEIFTGKPPYYGEDSMAIMFQHVEGNAVPPRQKNPELSHQLERIILKTIAVDPDERYQTFHELESALEQLQMELA